MPDDRRSTSFRSAYSSTMAGRSEPSPTRNYMRRNYCYDLQCTTLTEMSEQNPMHSDEVAREHAHVCRLLWANARGQWLGEPALERVAATLGVRGEDYLPADIRMRQASDFAP